MEQLKKVRLGIIGCGGMANNSHCAGLHTLKDVLEVTATCDIEISRAEEAAKLTGATYVTADYHTMLDYVDAVLIVLPHHLHYECGMFFAQHGKHILMEKPLCNTEEECLSLVEEAEKQHVKLMCAYPVRYWRGIRKLKELLDSGEYGTSIMQMSIWTEQYTNDPGKPWQFRADQLGGGQLFSHGCHYIDLLLWFLGEPVSGVHMGSKVNTPWMDKEGNSNVIIKFKNGAMGYHFGTWGARGSVQHYDFQIHTEKGMFDYFSDDYRLQFRTDVKADENYARVTTWDLKTNGDFKQTQHEIRHFVDCILNDKKPLTDGRSAMQSLRVIWRLYEAEEKNEIADLRGLGLDD